MTEAEKQMLVSEVNLLRELKHPNIVRYYDRIIDRTNTTLYIVMEHCEGGDLAGVIAKGTKERQYLEEEFVLRVMTQLALALRECHRRSDGGHTVLHRDLKPANVFLDARQNVKLGDFGLARILKHDTSFAKTFVGTPYYMSPLPGTEGGGRVAGGRWPLAGTLCSRGGGLHGSPGQQWPVRRPLTAFEAVGDEPGRARARRAGPGRLLTTGTFFRRFPSFRLPGRGAETLADAEMAPPTRSRCAPRVCFGVHDQAAGLSRRREGQHLGRPPEKGSLKAGADGNGDAWDSGQRRLEG
ncbi:PREDICTED: serine/threonine-protein kinase Nek2 [Condylura cristata]|uniref:serine/threonine-protein kinase Nek2 n=1 Tax=Condylura cristata TaxID=143302 RepID=UPI0006439B70|nr:PREDICTED: serine/threonine-protein kinase Nek2 [Condylura cristata]